MHDVVIAGAGPVGLFLASELARAKHTVLVVEAAEDPTSPLKRMPFGLRGLWGPSIEAFHRRGLLERIAPRTATTGAALAPAAPAQEDSTPPVPAPTPAGRGPGGHFAGLQFDAANVDRARWPYRLAGPGDQQFGVEMEQLEGALAAHAVEVGVDLRRGRAVDRLELEEDHVVACANEERFAGRYLIGCDGGRSRVRKLAGFDFVGTDPEITGYSLEVELRDPDALPLGRHSSPAGMYTQWQRGRVVLADFDGGAFHRTEPITRERAEALLRRITGVDVEVVALGTATTWTDRSQQTTTYRRGRVLLAGDAAHIHSPLGGQGLNLGLGDAMNLGWKLSATLRGDAPQGLLDSYTTERHPIGARILEWTRAQIASMRPDRGSRALQSILRDLIGTRDGATYFAERVWGVSLRYEGDNAHPLIGRSCPDFEFADGRRVGTLLRDGAGLLLDFSADSPLRSIAGRWGDRVRYVDTTASPVRDALGLSVVLVRPDGFVAWASADEPNVDELTRAAARWFRSG